MYCTFLKKKHLIITAILLAVAITSVIILSTTKAHAVFYGGNLRELPIYYVKRNDKKVALTFDCAWGVDYTDSLLETMEQENVKCTFFTVEFWAKKHPEYLKKISEKGHEIGTHSATHPYMSKLSKMAIEKELTTSKEVIEQITGKKVTVFRPPYGDYNDLLIRTSNELGLRVIQWDVDSLDWKDLSATEIKNRVLKRVKNGSIVLFHNQGKHTSQALPIIIKELKLKGYEFCSVGDLIYTENYGVEIDGGQYQKTNDI